MIQFISPQGIRIDVEIETTIKKRHYLSLTHVESAKRFYRWAKQIESTGALPSLPDHMTFTVYGVIACATFLESTINEFFEDIASSNFDRHNSFKDIFSAEQIKNLKNEWEENGAERSSVLKKYSLALKICNRENFNGNKTYQMAALVIAVRNFLLHYKPDSQIFNSLPEKMKDVERNPTFELCAQLRGKYECNPLMPGKGDFPSIVMSAGCIDWAIKSSVEFVVEFFTRLGALDAVADMRKHLEKVAKDGR